MNAGGDGRQWVRERVDTLRENRGVCVVLSNTCVPNASDIFLHD